MKTSDTDQEDVIERSWDLVKEAITTGIITLGLDQHGKPSQRTLDTEDVIDLAKFFVQLKIKKPQLITPPEDYEIRPTIDQGNEED